MSALTQMLETWEARSRGANPCDAMLINKHIREVRELLAANAVSETVGINGLTEAETSASMSVMGLSKPQAPYANCRFRICDLPGQCKGEGKCHHPAVAQAQGEARSLTLAKQQWEIWKQYALELQERLVKYEGGAPMVLNASHPQATKPQAVTSGIRLAQLVQAHCERNLSHEVDAKMAEQIADLLVSDPATEQFLRRLLAGSGTTDTAEPEQKP